MNGSAMTTRERPKKTAEVYEVIKSGILAGRYRPGARLVLSELAEETGTSSFPVREALRRLEAEGYVTYKHNSGARVAELDTDEYEQTQFLIAVLEGAATLTAAPHLDEAVLAEAAEVNERMRECRENFDAEGFMSLNARFHELICSPSPNAHLLESLETERNRMALLRRPTMAVVMRHSLEFVQEHQQLLDLIRENPHSPEIQMLAQSHKMRILNAVHDEVG